MHSTGVHPSQDPAHEILFRKAIMMGLPSLVRGKMEDNPDFPDTPSDRWETHLRHYMRAHNSERSNQENEIDDLKTQLLKIQLKEARDKANA